MIPTSLLMKAVQNNALWCDAVCGAHGTGGTFSATLWFHGNGTPPFYPDAITLTEAPTAEEQKEAIVALLGSRTGAFAVKDSFAALDLEDLGFRKLFDAQWLGLEPPFDIGASRLDWERIEDAAGLARFEAEWSKGSDEIEPRIFRDPLLGDPSLAFFLARRGRSLLGGGILNAQGPAVGLSNLFAHAGDGKAIRQGLMSQAARLFPGLPLVGYEEGEALDEAIDLGFSALGPLRVWLREPPALTEM